MSSVTMEIHLNSILKDVTAVCIIVEIDPDGAAFETQIIFSSRIVETNVETES